MTNLCLSFAGPKHADGARIPNIFATMWLLLQAPLVAKELKKERDGIQSLTDSPEAKQIQSLNSIRPITNYIYRQEYCSRCAASGS